MFCFLFSELPPDKPTIKAEKGWYASGDSLRAQCSSPPADPPANLTWLLNGRDVSIIISTYFLHGKRIAIKNVVPYFFKLKFNCFIGRLLISYFGTAQEVLHKSHETKTLVSIYVTYVLSLGKTTISFKTKTIGIICNYIQNNYPSNITGNISLYVFVVHLIMTPIIVTSLNIRHGRPFKLITRRAWVIKGRCITDVLRTDIGCNRTTAMCSV